MKVKQENLKLNPFHIDENCWYYEDPKGLDIIHEVHAPNGDYMRSDHIRISWAKLKKHLEHYEKAARREGGKA